MATVSAIGAAARAQSGRVEALFADLARCGSTDPGFARAPYTVEDIEALAVATPCTADLGRAVGRYVAANTKMTWNVHRTWRGAACRNGAGMQLRKEARQNPIDLTESKTSAHGLTVRAGSAQFIRFWDGRAVTSTTGMGAKLNGRFCDHLSSGMA